MDERDNVSLWVKFPVDGWGTIEDLDFRHRLEDDLTELLEHHHLGLWEGSGQGGGVQDVSYSVPTSSLEAAWDVVRAKLAELGVLQRPPSRSTSTTRTDHPGSYGRTATCPSASWVHNPPNRHFLG